PDRPDPAARRLPMETREFAPSGTGTRSTREKIKAVAAELYVLRGHDGFSFGDIAGAIGTTRANIHHHFGSKRQLMDELIEDIAADAERRIEQHWVAGNRSFRERLALQLADLNRLYDRFNSGPGGRNVCSPLYRVRHDLSVLGEPAAAAQERVNRAYDRSLDHAIGAAIRGCELSPAIPRAATVRIFRAALLSCPPMTQ